MEKMPQDDVEQIEIQAKIDESRAREWNLQYKISSLSVNGVMFFATVLYVVLTTVQLFFYSGPFWIIVAAFIVMLAAHIRRWILCGKVKKEKRIQKELNSGIQKLRSND